MIWGQRTPFLLGGYCASLLRTRAGGRSHGAGVWAGMARLRRAQARCPDERQHGRADCEGNCNTFTPAIPLKEKGCNLEGIKYVYVNE